MTTCLIMKSVPRLQQHHAVQMMFTLWLHNNTTRPVISPVESAFLSLSHIRALIGRNYRAASLLKTSPLGGMVLLCRVIRPRQSDGSTRRKGMTQTSNPGRFLFQAQSKLSFTYCLKTIERRPLNVK